MKIFEFCYLLQIGLYSNKLYLSGWASIKPAVRRTETFVRESATQSAEY